MAKLSINLSQPIHDRLGEHVKAEDANASVVCEAALILFERADAAVRAKLVRQLLAVRRPQTPTSWRTLFWSALAEEFDLRDMSEDPRYLMAARVYDGFQVIFDAQHSLKAGHEHEIVVFTDTAPPYTDRTHRIGSSWTFSVNDSVFTAAHVVAEWVKANKAQLVA
jgi:hypothetical protein